MSPVHQVWPKPSCKVQRKGEEDKADRKKRWEDNIREWTGLEFGRSQGAVENRDKWKKTGRKTICGAPTIFVVKGQVKVKVNKPEGTEPTDSEFSTCIRSCSRLLCWSGPSHTQSRLTCSPSDRRCCRSCRPHHTPAGKCEDIHTPDDTALRGTTPLFWYRDQKKSHVL